MIIHQNKIKAKTSLKFDQVIVFVSIAKLVDCDVSILQQICLLMILFLMNFDLKEDHHLKILKKVFN